MAEIKRILITGGAGFLGLHCANTWADRGLETMTLLDIAGFDETEYPKNAKLIKGDVRDVALMDKLFAEDRYDLVVHAAAALPLWPKKEIFSTNVDGTRVTLEIARKHKVPRVVFISSTAVYGVPKRHPLYESDPMVGVGAYGESKIRGEAVCREFRSPDLCVPIIRPKTFIGPERLGVFQILYDWVESGVRIPMIGWGNNPYQLMDVADLVEAIWLVGTHPDTAKVNQEFNVGAMEYTTVRQDVGALCEYAKTGSKPLGTPAMPIKTALMIFEALKLSPLYKWIYGTADKESFVSTEKIQSLGWKSRYSNADALIRSYQWYLDNKHKIHQGTGVTHRIAWDQSILGVFKKFLKF